MMGNIKLYRFSPITTENVLREAVSYVAEQTTKLCKKVIGMELSIEPLTIFSHYPGEFEELKDILFTWGEKSGEANGPYVKLHNFIHLPHNQLHELRIRQPDPYRMQVGCNDFVVPIYEEFKEMYLEKCANNLRLIQRPEYEMIEFFDPDFDVLAYVVSK